MGDYEELEDDFLFLANEGQPALIPQDAADDDDQEYENKGVIHVKDEMEERLAQMREALATLHTNKTDYMEELKKQEKLDQKFEDIMDQEYADDQIGDVEDEEVEPENILGENELNDAVDEFIES